VISLREPQCRDAKSRIGFLMSAPLSQRQSRRHYQVILPGQAAVDFSSLSGPQVLISSSRTIAAGTLWAALIAAAVMPLAIASTDIAVPASLAVREELPAPAHGVTALRFRDIYRNPVGPLGLELSERVRALDGQRVRMVGFMVAEEEARPGVFMFAPLPVRIGHDDEGLADDLPPSTVFVHLPTAAEIVVPHLPGLLQLSGTLSVGAQAESDSGRISTVRLLLDKRTARRFRKLDRQVAGRSRQRH
jgi:hypothetical protein